MKQQRRRARSRQAGFTMIELLVALLITSLLVAMVLSIFSRMSVAYREQEQIAQVQQVLAGARSMIERDAKQAGFAMSDGFRMATYNAATDTNMHSPVVVTDSSTGPDTVAFYYADAGVQAAVTTVPTAWPGTPTLTVDSTTGFTTGMLVVMSSPDTGSLSGLVVTDAPIAMFNACVLQVSSISAGSPGSLTFSNAAPWGISNESHCTTTPAASKTMIYKFAARAYRIDPARIGDGVLQVSPTGNLQTNTTDWQDLAFGFTDIQVATYFYEKGDITDTPDPDTDPQRDWYSDTTQATNTAPALPIAIPLTTFKPALQQSISLVARTDRDIEGVPSSFTPALLVSGNLNNNIIGNHAAVPLATTTDPTLTGNRIFRYTTFRVDFRNMGVGR